ncbi:MAG TPA: ribose-phosphate pyrophosphokinase [Terracidiphilus sp.]|nr:ribose-phosphate pyrophosphokinase [Terracidiphilus sp.]
MDRETVTDTVTVTLEEKRQDNPEERNAQQRSSNAGRDGAKSGSGSGGVSNGGADAAQRAKDAKAGPERSGSERPAPERKRSRNLSEDRRFKLFSGTANRALAEEIAGHIGVKVGEAKLQRFADGEVYFQLLDNVRGVDVFVVQPTCYPVDQHLVELFIMIDALKRASAARITVVVPYYGYARQDRKDRPRVAISAKLVADLLTTAGANRALFVDLHAAQIQGFFDIPVDHMFASPVLVSYFKDLNLPNLTVVSPDAGGVERARHFAQKMEAPLAIVDKRRTDINVAEVMNIVGDVTGKTCLIIDDIIDTAGTLVKTVDALYANGATAVYACASHAVLSGPAIDRIANSRLEQVVVTNTIPLREAAEKLEKIKVLSVAGLLGAAIENIHLETSVSTLFS